MNFRSSKYFLEFSIIGRKFCSRDDRHVALPAVPGWSPGRGHSGHAAQPECARGNTLAGHVAHSEASGENYTRWTRGALGGFREGPIGLGTRDTWRARKVS